MAIADLLRGCPLFFELHDSEIEKLVQFCGVYTFESGEFVVKDGEEGDEIFIVLDGRLSVQKNLPSGVLKIQTLTSGDVFGEMVLVDERIRSADIVAEFVSYVLEIKYKDMFRLFDLESKIFGILILNISRLLAKRLRSSNQIISRLQKEVAESKKESG